MQKLQERLKGLVSDVKSAAAGAKEGGGAATAGSKKSSASGSGVAAADSKPSTSGSGGAGPSGSGSGARTTERAERPRRPPTPKIVEAGPLVPVSSRVHARIGLLGNPSDGFFGKTISLSLENFYAEVKLTPGKAGSGIRFTPHPLHDKQEYADLADFAARVGAEGYYGGVRLLMAALKVFSDYSRERGYVLPKGRDDFVMSYDTNVPRQAGLSGSSAIACAAVNCLFSHYGVPMRDLSIAERPNLVLAVEQELGITAGLQDRVIQVYGGVVFMDFEKSRFKRKGYGRYEPLLPELLPRLWLIYANNPSDSGRVHSDVKRRWLDGDADVREKMELIAACAEEGRLALETGNVAALAALMDRNFDLRRELYGDAALGATNLKMVQTARSVGAAAKFTGSGGAVVAFCPMGEGQEQLLQDVVSAAGFTIVEVKVAPPTSQQG